MSKNQKTTELDFHQYDAETYDTELQARRVILVGGENLNIKANVGKSTDIRIEKIEVPKIIVETKIQTIEVPKIIYETKFEKIEIPVYVKETEIKYVDRPIIEVQYKEVHIPIVTEKFKEVPMWFKVCFALQSLAIIGLCLIKLIK